MTILFLSASPAGSSANLIASEIFPTASRTIVLFMVSMLGGMSGYMFRQLYCSFCSHVGGRGGRLLPVSQLLEQELVVDREDVIIFLITDADDAAEISCLFTISQ